MKNTTLKIVLFLVPFVLFANESIEIMPPVSKQQKVQAYLYADTPFLMSEELFYYDAQVVLGTNQANAKIGAYFPISTNQSIKAYYQGSDLLLGFSQEKGNDYLALRYQYTNSLHLPSNIASLIQLEHITATIGGQYLYINRNDFYAHFSHNTQQNFRPSYSQRNHPETLEEFYKYDIHTIALLASLGVVKNKFHSFIDATLESRRHKLNASMHYVYNHHLRIGTQLLHDSITPLFILYPTLTYVNERGAILEIGRYLNIPNLELKDSPLTFRFAWVK